MEPAALGLHFCAGAGSSVALPLHNALWGRCEGGRACPSLGMRRTLFLPVNNPHIVYFEQIRVFQAGSMFALNTLAWNNEVGLRFRPTWARARW